MRETKTSFCSDRISLAGMWLESDNAPPDAQAPVVVICSGFTGLMAIHPSRFARALTAKGWRCFVFDYRGFGDSDGEKGRTILDEWVRDMRAACSHVSDDARTEPGKIALVAWGMGAGAAIAAAECAPELEGVAALNGFYDGPRFLRSHLDDKDFKSYVERVNNARAVAAHEGVWPEAKAGEIYPLDPSSAEYVEDHLSRYAAYDWTEYQLCFADSLLRWHPESIAARLRIPLFLAHGTKNALHLPSEADCLERAYGGQVTRYDIQDAGHTEWMHDEHPYFKMLASKLARWLDSLSR